MNSKSLDDLRLGAKSKIAWVGPPRDESQRLLHELRVQRVELELQNEKLRRANQEAEASRQRYEDVFAFAPIGYLVLGPDGVIEANERAARLFGVPREELTGVPLERFVVPESSGAFECHRRAVLDCVDRVSGEITVVTRSGRRRQLRLESLCTSVIRQQWRVALIDISDQRRLERKVAESERSKAEGRATRALEYDLRHALMTILGSAEVALLELEPDHAACAPLEDLKQIALGAGELVGDLLASERPSRQGYDSELGSSRDTGQSHAPASRRQRN